MKIQRFVGQDMASALEMVREALGDDAVILETRTVEVERGPKLFEVVAAVKSEDSGIAIETGFNLCATEKELFSKGPYLFGLIGPSGAGKTTSLMKLALRLKKKGAKFSIVNTDNVRPGAEEALKKVAGLLEVPFYNVTGPMGLLRVASRVPKGQAMLADFAGVNLYDVDAREKISQFFSAIPKMKAIGVFPCNMNVMDAKGMLKAISDLPVRGIIVTKADEAAHEARVKEFIEDLKINVVYVSSGTRLTEGFTEFRLYEFNKIIKKKQQFLLKDRKQLNIKTYKKELSSGIYA